MLAMPIKYKITLEKKIMSQILKSEYISEFIAYVISYSLGNKLYIYIYRVMNKGEQVVQQLIHYLHDKNEQTTTAIPRLHSYLYGNLLCAPI